MCGIFGLVTSQKSDWYPNKINEVTKNLYRLSESRGKEASGFAFFNNETINVYKQPIPASKLIKSNEFKNIFKDDEIIDSASEKSKVFIGHSRLVTNGALEKNENNQPVVTSGLVGVHNGIIVNDNELWNKFPEIDRKYEVDTEIILSLMRYFYQQSNSIVTSIRKVYDLIYGAASIALLFEDFNNVLLASNNGSLYVYNPKNKNIIIFASELYILKMLLKKSLLNNNTVSDDIFQLKPNQACLINFDNLRLDKFSLNKNDDYPKVIYENSGLDTRHRINEINKNENTHEGINVLEKAFNLPKEFIQHFSRIEEKVSRLKRCNKCVLPETIPFIEFDDKGICNFCRSYKKIEYKGNEELEQELTKYRNKKGNPDCVVAFSGGRDSSYGLHYIKTVLDLNPIAYSYDWGMITDLARRNQSRLTGKLGVEHVLISAEIAKKRKNIQKNVLAWLKKPDLGTIPLFMAGDKQYFYYANLVAKQTGVDLIILSENPFEKTDFKSGFCGVKPNLDTKSVYQISHLNKLRLAFYYGKQYLLNPTYINLSIMDTLSAFASYYLIKHDFLSLYNYIPWEEDHINSILINEYDWELANDTKTTWRIGDGTASFYNYIYYVMAGFTENDTLRSNQIRESKITREKALEHINEDNRARWESINWYCNTIGIDFENTIKKINNFPRLF